MAAQRLDRDAARTADPHRREQLAGIGIEHHHAARARRKYAPPGRIDGNGRKRAANRQRLRDA